MGGRFLRKYTRNSEVIKVILLNTTNVRCPSQMTAIGRKINYNCVPERPKEILIWISTRSLIRLASWYRIIALSSKWYKYTKFSWIKRSSKKQVPFWSYYLGKLTMPYIFYCEFDSFLTLYFPWVNSSIIALIVVLLWGIYLIDL